MSSDWDRSRQLDDLLQGRPDWHLENDPHSGWIWCFGQLGEARLVVSVVQDGFHLYDHDNDADHDETTIEGVRAWIELNEPTHAGVSELGQELGGHVLALEAEEWLQEPPESS